MGLVGALKSLNKGKVEVSTVPNSPKNDNNKINVGAFKTLKKSNNEMASKHRMFEMNRILNAPICRECNEHEIEGLSMAYLQKSALDEGMRLFPEQAKAISTFNKYGVLLAPISVGGGKTLISLMLSHIAHNKGIRKIMLIVPPALVEKLTYRDIKFWRQKSILNIPIWNLCGLSKKKRMLLANSNRAGLYIFSYSMLSNDHEVLEAVSPGLIICDEAHSVINDDSARTKRFNRYVKKTKAKVIALSGTLIKKTLLDYHTITKFCLGDMNFIPTDRNLTESWSKIIDVSASKEGVPDVKSTVFKPGILKPLITWARDNFPDEKIENSLIGARKAFQLRKTTMPGVVCSRDMKAPYSLYVRNRKVKNMSSEKGWDELMGHVNKLDELWETPNGENLDHAMFLFQWKEMMLGAGYYQERYWPSIEQMMKSRNYSSKRDAMDILEKSQEYFACQQQYRKDLRKWLSTTYIKGMDTPFLVGRDMHLHQNKNVTNKLYESWLELKNHEFEGRITRSKRSVRVCPFKVNEAVRWAQELPKKEGGLIWYKNDVVADWVSEKLEEAGLEHLVCKAGKEANILLANPDKCKGKLIVLSANAHYQGKDLQFDRNALMLQWIRPSDRMEQLIGRQSRPGQPYDEIYLSTIMCTEFDNVMMNATLSDAAFVHQSQANKQKLMLATYTPPPEIVPYEMLVEWGAQPQGYSQESNKLLKNIAKNI